MANNVITKGLFAVVFMALLLNAPCYGQRTDVAEIAKNITAEAGKVGDTYAGGSTGPVFVFEEYHTSRIGQLQIAIMLNRLRGEFGLREIGLEGMIQRRRPLDGTWFHHAGGENASSLREDVAVRILAEGEISAPELLTLVYPEIQVRGTEIREEYDVTLDVETAPAALYLLTIAQDRLTAQEINRINRLVEQEKIDEARELIFTSDPWVKRQYEALQDTSVTSIEVLLDRLREIQQKARNSDLTVDRQVRQDMDAIIHFYEVASHRSITMVNYVSNMKGVASGGPVAMAIGAAHTELVLRELRSRDISYVRITPLAFRPKHGTLSNDAFERKGIGKWARISPGTLGSILNGRKPPPVIETPTGQSYASMNIASILLARAARAGELESSELWSQVGNLPEFRLDRNSVSQDGDDVIFRAWLKDIRNREKQVWARVGTLDTPTQARDLEEKLLQAIADLGGGGRIPRSDPPSNTERVDDEGPGDGKRRGKVIARLNKNTVAVFASNKDGVLAAGRLSS